MAQKLDPKEIVSIEEMLLADAIQDEALVNRGGLVCLDRQNRFISDKLSVHTATCL